MDRPTVVPAVFDRCRPSSSPARRGPPLGGVKTGSGGYEGRPSGQTGRSGTRPMGSVRSTPAGTTARSGESYKSLVPSRLVRSNSTVQLTRKVHNRFGRGHRRWSGDRQNFSSGRSGNFKGVSGLPGPVPTLLRPRSSGGTPGNNPVGATPVNGTWTGTLRTRSQCFSTY